MKPPFRVYYDGGATYDGDPFYAPALGALLVVERDAEHGRRIVAGGDYYVWAGRWWPRDFVGMVDYLTEPGPRRVLIGRMIGNAEFTVVYRRAEADADFAPRTAFGAFERRA